MILQWILMFILTSFEMLQAGIQLTSAGESTGIFQSKKPTNFKIAGLTPSHAETFKPLF